MTQIVTDRANNELILIEWSSRYSLGIPKIDEQHKKLVRLTNELYASCLGDDEEMRERFKSTLSSLVQYVVDHFGAEERLLQRMKYPLYAEHKKEHESFVKKILEEVRLFHEGKSFVPNNFVRYLKDWILGHIAVSDKRYADYLFSLKEQGKI